MIRRVLHGRWRSQLPGPRDGALLVCAWWELDHWAWLDRYFEWSVDRFGEARGAGPWWDRRLVGPFCAWLADWRTTLGLRLGRCRLVPGAAEAAQAAWDEAMADHPPTVLGHQVRGAVSEAEHRLIEEEGT